MVVTCIIANDFSLGYHQWVDWLCIARHPWLAPSVNCQLYQPTFFIMVLVWLTLTIVCEPHWRAEAELFFWVEFYNRFSDMCFQVAILTTFGTWAATAEQLQIGREFSIKLVSKWHEIFSDKQSNIFVLNIDVSFEILSETNFLSFQLKTLYLINS